MRILGLAVLATVLLAQSPTAQAPAAAVPVPRSVGSIDDLMVNILYPMADALFYISPDPVPTDLEWKDLQTKALMVAEAGNLMMMPDRLVKCCVILTSIKPTSDENKWLRDARMLVDAGTAAFEATKKKDVDAVLAVSEQLYNACVQCHADYRPGYGRRPTTAAPAAP